MADPPEIDWSTASVAEGTLSVQLSGELPRGWSGRFNAVERLIDQAGGRWARVTLARGIVTVAKVRDGAEPDLRHFLESVVLQVNADLDLDRAPPGGSGDQQSAPERQRAADRAMAARFRAFGDPVS